MTASLRQSRPSSLEHSAVHKATDAAARTRHGAARRRRYDALIIGGCLLVMLMALADLGDTAKARRQPAPASVPPPAVGAAIP